jgi:hypothetical protein
MSKRFRLSKDDIRPLAPGRGGCLATGRITVDGLPVRFMYRELPDNRIDSGWRFMSGTEDDAYMDDPSHHGAYDVNTIANCDPAILPWLDAPVGSAFEKRPGSDGFVAVKDWKPRQD